MPLLHDVMNAYLAPLLKKHSAGTLITYEDLVTSLELAKAVLMETPNDFIMVRIILYIVVVVVLFMYTVYMIVCLD